MNLASDTFFAHVGDFMEYRETVYEISANTSAALPSMDRRDKSVLEQR
jgi:hypothetical protein